MTPNRGLACYQLAEVRQEFLAQGPKHYPEGWRDPRLGGGRMINVRGQLLVPLGNTNTRLCRSLPLKDLVLSTVFQYALGLNLTNNTTPGEPINLIITGNSDRRILTDWGFEQYARYVVKLYDDVDLIIDGTERGGLQVTWVRQ